MKKTAVCLVAGSLSLMAFSADIIWNGNNEYWTTASEWTPAQVPNINGGSDTATIGAGIVTNIPSGDWSNNSTVTITNDALWTQSGGGQWVRIAGNGNGNSGTLILKDSAEFNAGSASGVAVGIDGGDGTAQVNDNATLDADGANLMLGLYGPDSRGILDLNGGYVKANELWFNSNSTDARAQNTFGRLNISGGTIETTGGVGIWFWNSTAAGYDHAVNFDGDDGHIITRNPIKIQEGALKPTKTWQELYESGKLLRNGTKPGEFDIYFNLIALGNNDEDLSVRTPITWKGGVGPWYTATNWEGDAVPNVDSGANSVFINGGTAEYIPGGDWSNNSYVSLSNDAKWVQSSNGSWLRIAGNGYLRRGTLVLNDSSEFNAGTANRIVVGINGGIGTIIVNDSATLDMDGKEVVLGYHVSGQNGSSGTIDLNSGTVKTPKIWFSRPDAGSDYMGVNSYGRINISGGTFECTDTSESILFANINASNYDHAIDFDGEFGSITTAGPLKIEYDANTIEEKSWEELFNSGLLLRNGSNDGSFGDHFIVKDLGGGKQVLKLRSLAGTIILLN